MMGERRKFELIWPGPYKDTLCVGTSAPEPYPSSAIAALAALVGTTQTDKEAGQNAGIPAGTATEDGTD